MKEDFDGLENDHTVCLLSTQRSANVTFKDTAAHQLAEEAPITTGKVKEGSVFSFAAMKLVPPQNRLKTQESLLEDFEAQTENSACNFEMLRGRRLLQLAEVYTFGKTTSDSKRSMTNLGDQPYSSSQDLVDNHTAEHLQVPRVLQKKASGEDYCSPTRLSSEMRFHSTKLSSDLLRELREDYSEEEEADNLPPKKQASDSPKQLSLNVRKLSSRKSPTRGSPFGASNFLKFHMASLNEGDIISSSHKQFAKLKLIKSTCRAVLTGELQDERSSPEQPRQQSAKQRNKKHLKIEAEVPEEHTQLSSAVGLTHDFPTPQTSPHVKQRSTPELIKSKSFLLSESLAGRKGPINRLKSSETEQQPKRKPKPPVLKQIQRVVQAEERDQSQFSEMSEMKRSVFTPANQAPTPPAKASQRAADPKRGVSKFLLATEAAAPIKTTIPLFSSATVSKLMVLLAFSLFLVELLRSAAN